MPAAALCCGGLEPPSPGPGVTRRDPCRVVAAFGLLPPWCTPDGDSPRPPLSLGESVCPVRRLEGDVELAALAGELVDRATQNGDVDGRLQLDLAQRVALRLLRWRSPLLSYSPL